MGKYININTTLTGVTPLRISDVATIASANAGAGAANVSTFTLTYTDGGTAIITTQPIGAAGDAVKPTLPTTAAQRAAVVRALWQQVIKGVAQPWNLPMVGGEDAVYGFTTSPSAPQPVTGTLASKSSSQLLGTDVANVVGVMEPIMASIG